MGKDMIVSLARLGYAARAAVYIALGSFALLALIPGGMSGETGGTKGALAQIQRVPLGTPLLIVVGLGLFAFAIWRLIQSIRDVDDHGSDAKGLAIRGSLLLSSLTHGLLGVFALNMATGSASPGGGSSKQHWAAWAMSFPGGEILIMALGLIIFGFGLSQIIKAYTGRFKKYLNVGSMEWACRVSQIGLMARGAVFLIVGGFVIRAGWLANAQQITGTSEIWNFLSNQAYGQTLMVLMALGLVSYGVYNILEARLRRIEVA